MPAGSLLPVAVRAYTVRRDRNDQYDSSRRGQWKLPKSALVFDTETTTDRSQRLNFGSWRYYRLTWAEAGAPDMACVEEGLFYADDLPDRDPRGYDALLDYANRHAPAVSRAVADAAWRLELLSTHEFVNEVLHPLAFRGRTWVVGFNLPFDLSRVAYDDSESRDYLAGGFSLTLRQYLAKDGTWREHRWRSRVALKTIDSKRRLMGFKRPAEVDAADQVPEDGHEPDRTRAFRGHFLDLRTLAFALTNESYSLDRACEDFGVANGKQEAQGHGHIDEAYVDYNRRDVEATGDLFAKLLVEYRRHPIQLSPTKAFSPASVGKAYLRAMGVRPRLDRQPDFPLEVLGQGMVAYYGGRAECRIRRTPVPVVYADFLSMYPTVNSLMGLWDLVTAERVEPATGEEVKREIQTLLDELTLEQCFERSTWTRFVGLVKLDPQSDVLPVRSRYGHTESWGIGVNPFELGEAVKREVGGLWYTIPDAVAAKVLTGRTPRVLDGVRLNASRAKSEKLREAHLAGSVAIDPRTDDFFRVVIEERQRARRSDLPEDERERLDSFLKVLANSTSYGIYAEMVREELPRRKEEVVDVHGALPQSFADSVPTPEEPGEFSFPPMAACITGGARLMLALLERLVTEQGGRYAFCDTDSMAIVASEHGGLVPCPGGEGVASDGREAVKALSWDEVELIRERFESLNPYDPKAVGGSVLEVEDQNFETKARKKQRQLYCYAISAKRYALYSLDEHGNPVLRKATKSVPGEKWSEHGLGHLLNPRDPGEDARDWIRELWEVELRRVLGVPSPEPEWLSRPAIGRVTIGKPRTLEPFEALNAGKPYAEQIKPFNFLLTAHLPQFVVPPDNEDPQRFQLVAPWEPDASKWLELNWANKYATGSEPYVLTTDGSADGSTTARVQSYADVLAEYRVHPEPKSLAPDGKPAGWHGNGLLKRRAVTATRLVHVGKEANELDEIQAGVIRDTGEVLNQHLAESVWFSIVVPVLQRMTRAALRAHLSGTRISRLRRGALDPGRRATASLTRVAHGFAREQLREVGAVPPANPVDCCAAYLQLADQKANRKG